MLAKFGLNKEGFRRKQYTDILSDMEANAKQLFGDDINLSERSPLGLFLRVIAWTVNLLWQIIEKVFYSSYVDTAEGNSLDNVAKYIGISRIPSQKAEGKVEITGDVDTEIPKSFRVATKDNIVFETIEEGVIDGTGKVILPISAVKTGSKGNVPPKTITEIVNPTSGVSSVINLESTDQGREMETDMEFRERYHRSISKGGSSTRESVEATLLNMIEIKDARVEENTTMEYVGDIPPKSIAPFVYGADDIDIAKEILGVKAAGIQAYGTTEVLVKDSKGVEHTIGFTRPTIKGIYVNIKLTTGLDYSIDTEKQIKTAIVKYIGGIDEDKTDYDGLGFGEDVVLNKIIGACIIIDGVEDIEVELSTNGITYTPSNIVIGNKEVAITDYNKVVIS